MINVDESWLNDFAYLLLKYHQYLLWGINMLMPSVAVGCYSVDFYFFLAMVNSLFQNLSCSSVVDGIDKLFFPSQILSATQLRSLLYYY